jgi:ATP-dependent DNA ligase
MPRSQALPLAPMEAMSVAEIPVGDQWQYEPKWDGFRCLAFRSGNEIQLRSKSWQPFERYFPELVAAFLALPARQFVLDGEIVIPVGGRLSFDELLLRIHPAESRVRKLAADHPAMFIAFDLLRDAKGRSLLDKPLQERRLQLEAFSSKYLIGHKNIRLSPATKKLTVAQRWFRTTGGNLDGIIAKRVDFPYRSEKRDGMQKIKRQRRADCVVGRLPDDDTLLGLPKRGHGPPYSHDRIFLYTMRKRGIPFDRLTVLTVKHPAPKTQLGGAAWDWKDLDYHLEADWQLK